MSETVVKRIRLLSGDVKIKKWWEYASKEGSRTASSLIQMAIQYHIDTGEYLCIGSVPREDVEIKDSIKCFRYQQGSATDKWFTETMRRTGLDMSFLFKAILENSIRDADSYSLPTKAETYNMFTRREAAVVTAPAAIEPVRPAAVVEPAEIPVYVPYKEPTVEPAEPEEEEEPDFEEEEDMGGSFIHNLISESGSGLG